MTTFKNLTLTWTWRYFFFLSLYTASKNDIFFCLHVL
jgi:hypothetical protein